MKTLPVRIITPSEVAYSSEAEYVVLPTTNGEMAIYPGHEPVIALLKNQPIRVHLNGEISKIEISTGVAEVLPTKVEIFAKV